MKTNKSQQEAVLRAHQSIEENQQDQEKLYRPTATTNKETSEDPAAAMNESHQNKMEHYQHLRKLDVELAKKKSKK